MNFSLEWNEWKAPSRQLPANAMPARTSDIAWSIMSFSPLTGVIKNPGDLRLRTGDGRIGRDIPAAAAPHR
jgi:hypothetical protein